MYPLPSGLSIDELDRACPGYHLIGLCDGVEVLSHNYLVKFGEGRDLKPR